MIKSDEQVKSEKQCKKNIEQEEYEFVHLMNN